MADESRVIVVTGRRVLREGVSASGRPWTLYTIEATTADHTPIDETLKSFDALPIGIEQTVNVEVQKDEKYGTSIMLKADGFGLSPGEVQARLEAKIVELDERVKLLEQVAEQPAVQPKADPVAF